MKTLLGLVASISLLLITPQLRADSVTYTYTGNAFETHIAPFTIGDFVSGTVTLNAPLPLNSTLTNYTSDVTAIDLTDGLDTINSLTTSNTGEEFYFATSGGVITQWAVEVYNSNGLIGIGTVSLLPSNNSNVIDYGEHCATKCIGNNYSSAGYVEVNPGSWTVETTAATPEPGTLGSIFLVGAVLLPVARRLRKRAG